MSAVQGPMPLISVKRCMNGRFGSVGQGIEVETAGCDRLGETPERGGLDGR